MINRQVQQRENTINALNETIGIQQETFEKKMFTMQQQIQQLMDKTHSQETLIMTFKQQQDEEKHLQNQQKQFIVETLSQRVQFIEEEINGLKNHHHQQQHEQQMLSKETVKSMIQRQVIKQFTKSKQQEQEQEKVTIEEATRAHQDLQQQQLVLTQRLNVHDQTFNKMITQIQDLSILMSEEKDKVQQIQQIEQKLHQQMSEQLTPTIQKLNILQQQQEEINSNAMIQLQDYKRKIKQLEETIDELKQIFHLTKK
jgi:chromosome segregation ATPase